MNDGGGNFDADRAVLPGRSIAARLKRALSALGIDPGVYADVKDPACDLIYIAAEAWAAKTGWALR